MHLLRQFLGFAAIILLGALLGAGGYESVVMAPNFQNNIPSSLEHFHQFMRVANPGHFFRVAAPAAQVALLACVLVFWRNRGSRWWYVLALVAAVSADVVTFTFHYPRNHFLFHSPMTEPVDQLAVAAHEWATGNVFRLVLLVISILAACLGLKKALFGTQAGPTG